jgi:hypothetical protein
MRREREGRKREKGWSREREREREVIERKRRSLLKKNNKKMKLRSLQEIQDIYISVLKVNPTTQNLPFLMLCSRLGYLNTCLLLN